MSLIELYILFCLTTTITSVIVVLVPVIQRVRSVQPNNPVAMYPKLSYITYGILGILPAPLLFLLLFNNTMQEGFIDTFYSALIEE